MWQNIVVETDSERAFKAMTQLEHAKWMLKMLAEAVKGPAKMFF